MLFARKKRGGGNQIFWEGLKAIGLDSSEEPKSAGLAARIIPLSVRHNLFTPGKEKKGGAGLKYVTEGQRRSARDKEPLTQTFQNVSSCPRFAGERGKGAAKGLGERIKPPAGNSRAP